MSGLATPPAAAMPAEPAPSSVAPVRKYARIWEWARLIALTGAGQVAVQAIGFVCGILVIRLLPTEEYALYTLANTMLGTMTLLADGGIATGVMSEGGKVWQDRKKLGSVLATGLQLRKKFAFFSLLVATPILFYLLHHHGASSLTATLIVLSLIPAFFSALSGTLLEIVPKLHQEVSSLQRIQVTSNALRLVLTALFVFVFPVAGVAILSSGVSQIYANIRLRMYCDKHAKTVALTDPSIRSALQSQARTVLPLSIYYSVCGQITTWLVSILGSSSAIAQIGALGRLSALLTILSGVISTLIIPRFARTPNVPRILAIRFVQTQAVLIGIGLVVVLSVRSHTSVALWLLGNQYSHLEDEVVLMAAASAISMLCGCAYTMCLARGFVPPPHILIPVAICVQVLLSCYLTPHNVATAFMFSIAFTSFLTLTQYGYFAICICKLSID